MSEDLQVLADRDWWRELGKRTGWTLAAFTDRAVADFCDGGRQLIEITAKVRTAWDKELALQADELARRERENAALRTALIGARKTINSAGYAISGVEDPDIAQACMELVTELPRIDAALLAAPAEGTGTADDNLPRGFADAAKLHLSSDETDAEFIARKFAAPVEEPNV